MGIKIEKYKQIIPDNYFGRHAVSVYDTCTAACCYCTEDTYSVQAGYSIFRIGDQTRKTNNFIYDSMLWSATILYHEWR